MKKIIKQILKLFFIATIFFMLPSFVSAGIVDSNIYPRPASPPTFGTDHKAIDPIFGTTLLRVTGPVGSNAIRESDAENQNIAPVQHFHNPWNITGICLLFGRTDYLMAVVLELLCMQLTIWILR
ncbi:MAG: hypothetical protein ACD_7C00265G0003 [uncultured bacterium]|nr:MAG: hypothetical protein ACD_7C00265G0003 [uncultured bacterium]HBR79127.1 hypothetical protein [Candidatus Moranbacteria bacterium]